MDLMWNEWGGFHAFLMFTLANQKTSVFEPKVIHLSKECYPMSTIFDKPYFVCVTVCVHVFISIHGVSKGMHTHTHTNHKHICFKDMTSAPSSMPRVGGR